MQLVIAVALVLRNVADNVALLVGKDPDTVPAHSIVISNVSFLVTASRRLAREFTGLDIPNSAWSKRRALSRQTSATPIAVFLNMIRLRERCGCSESEGFQSQRAALQVVEISRISLTR